MTPFHIVPYESPKHTQTAAIYATYIWHITAIRHKPYPKLRKASRWEIHFLDSSSLKQITMPLDICIYRLFALLAARSWSIGAVRAMCACGAFSTAGIPGICISGTLHIIRCGTLLRKRPDIAGFIYPTHGTAKPAMFPGRPLFAYRPLFLRSMYANLLCDHISQLFHRRRVAVTPAPVEVLFLIIMEITAVIAPPTVWSDT